MAEHRPLVCIDGITCELPVGDTLIGAGSTEAFQAGVSYDSLNHLYTVRLSTDGATYQVRRADRVTQVITYSTGLAPAPVPTSAEVETRIIPTLSNLTYV